MSLIKMEMEKVRDFKFVHTYICPLFITYILVDHIELVKSITSSNMYQSFNFNDTPRQNFSLQNQYNIKMTSIGNLETNIWIRGLLVDPITNHLY